MKIRRLFSCLALLVVVAAPLKAENVIKVNGVVVSNAQIDLLVKQLVKEGKKDTPALRQVVANEIIYREVLVQEAKKQGLDKQEDLKLQIDMARERILIDALRRKHLEANPITDKAVKAEYERLVKAHKNDIEYHSRHILFETEVAAKAALAKLRNGEKFEELAKQSKDVGTSKNGGDLGWASPKKFVPAFANAIVKMKKGELSATPIKSEFGYHVIQIVDLRKAVMPTFAQAKGPIEKMLKDNTLRKYQTALIQKTKIEQK